MCKRERETNPVCSGVCLIFQEDWLNCAISQAVLWAPTNSKELAMAFANRCFTALMSKEFPTKLSCYTNIKVSCKFRTRGAHGGSARHPGCHGDQGLPWPPALQAQPQVFLSMPLEVSWGWIREGFCLKEQGRFAEARERMTKTTKLLGEFPTPLDCYIWYFNFRSEIYLQQKKLIMRNINFKNC